MIILSIEEIKKFIPVNSHSIFKTIQPEINSVTPKYLKPLLGKSLYKELLQLYNDSQGSSSGSAGSASGSSSGSASASQSGSSSKGSSLAKAELLTLCQKAVSLIAYANAFPLLNIDVSDAGLKQLHSENAKPAFQWAIHDAQDYLRNNGHDTLDEILDYLNENIQYFNSYKTSEAYVNARKLFVNTTAVFNDIYPINGSNLVYRNFMRFLKLSQDNLIPSLIGHKYFDYLFQKFKENKVTNEHDTTILNRIQAIMVYNAVRRGFNDLGLVISDKSIYFQGLDALGENSVKREKPSDKTVARIIANALSDEATYIQGLREYIFKNIDELPLIKETGTYSQKSTEIRDNTNKKTHVV